MAKPAASGRAAPEQDVPTAPAKRNFGARGIAGLLAPVVRPAFARRAPAGAVLLADWPNLAGAELAARAAPVKFAGGTLTLACGGPAALELQHAAPDIIARLNLALGHRMVERLRFVQQAPVLAAPLPAPAPAKPPAPAGLPDGPLGEALARLYQAMQAKED
jgi:hypothetical protein